MTKLSLPADETKQAPVFNMKEWREKTKASVDTSKKGRKAKHKKVTESAEPDGRSLRATGRTEQVNFKAHPAVKKALDTHVGKGKISLWLEQAIIAKLREEGFDVEG